MVGHGDGVSAGPGPGYLDQSQTRRSVPDVAAATGDALRRHLSAASTWEKRAAWHQIVLRSNRAGIPGLVSLARDPKTPTDLKKPSLWALEGLGHFEARLWRELLASREEDLPLEAVRSLSTVSPSIEVALALLRPLTDEPMLRVRHEVLRYFRQTPEPLNEEQLNWLQRWRTSPELTRTVKGWDRESLAPGGTYESAFQNLLRQIVKEKGWPKIFFGTDLQPVAASGTDQFTEVGRR